MDEISGVHTVSVVLVIILVVMMAIAIIQDINTVNICKLAGYDSGQFMFFGGSYCIDEEFTPLYEVLSEVLTGDKK